MLLNFQPIDLVKSDFPKLTWTIPVLSALYQIYLLNSANVVSSVLVTVPDFYEGIKPLGPRTLLKLSQFRHHHI
jgi:hypothetical protein